LVFATVTNHKLQIHRAAAAMKPTGLALLQTDPLAARLFLPNRDVVDSLEYGGCHAV
jgi:hypothetical protein